jgi:hypothetical protein
MLAGVCKVVVARSYEGKSRMRRHTHRGNGRKHRKKLWASKGRDREPGESDLSVKSF